jgi:hypothetical protein
MQKNIGAIASALWVVGCWAAKVPAPGEYLSESYVEVLEATRSPSQAAKTPNPQSLKVIGDSSQVRVATTYDFNEGGPLFALGPKDSATVIEGFATKPQFVIHDVKSFSLAYKGHPKMKFRNTESTSQFVNQICLVGKFIGTKQEKIEFTPQGEWIENGAKRRYSIGLYYPPNFKRDYFQMDSSEYGFKRNGDTLRIFPVKGGSLFEGGEMADSASMVLILAPKSRGSDTIQSLRELLRP